MVTHNYPIYIVSHGIKWVTTSWTFNIISKLLYIWVKTSWTYSMLFDD